MLSCLPSVQGHFYFHFLLLISLLLFFQSCLISELLACSTLASALPGLLQLVCASHLWWWVGSDFSSPATRPATSLSLALYLLAGVLFKAQVSLSSRSLRRELEEEVKVNDATSRPGPAGPFLLTNLLPALPLLRKASLNFHPSLVGHQLADLLLYLLLLRSCRVRRRGRSVVR